MIKNPRIFFILGLVFVGGFGIGKIRLTPAIPVVTETRIQPEMSLVLLEKIVGDELYFSISGPARVIWGADNFVEGGGEQRIALGQIPHDLDLPYLTFPYVGNVKTGKFYSADSYFARGVAVAYRRFFANKAAAIAAGFIPTKGVK